MNNTIFNFSAALPYATHRRKEKLEESHPFFRAIVQEVQIESALKKVSELSEVYSRVPTPSSRIVNFLQCAPYVFAAVVYFKDSVGFSPVVKTAELLHEQSGKIAFIASLVSALALLYFGQILVGGLSLVFMGVGELNAADQLSPFTQKTFSCLGAGVTLIFGPTSARILACLDLAEIADAYLADKWYSSPAIKPFEPTSILGLDPYSIKGNHLEINPDHIFYSIEEEGQDLRNRVLHHLREFRKQQIDQEFVSMTNEAPKILENEFKRFKNGSYIKLRCKTEVESPSLLSRLIGFKVAEYVLSRISCKEINKEVRELIYHSEELFFLWNQWTASHGLSNVDEDNMINLFLIQQGIFNYDPEGREEQLTMPQQQLEETPSNCGSQFLHAKFPDLRD